MTTSTTPRSVLLVAATEAEVASIRPALRKDVHVLVTGVGMVATVAPVSGLRTSVVFLVTESTDSPPINILAIG